MFSAAVIILITNLQIVREVSDNFYNRTIVSNHTNRQEVPSNKISVVYFTMIHRANEHWQNVLREQLMSVNESGLFQVAASFDALLSTNISSDLFNQNDQDLLDLAQSIVLEIAPQANVFTWIGNQYEFHGIRRMWDLGQKDPSNNHYVLYFHGKGMVNGDGPRSEENVKLTNIVVVDWKNVIRQFESNPNMSYAGYAISHWGSAWYNFMWARGSYLKNSVKPKLCERRHYYEDWLGRRTNQSSSSYKSETCDRKHAKDENWAGPDHGLSLCENNTKKELGLSADANRIGIICKRLARTKNK